MKKNIISSLLILAAMTFMVGCSSESGDEYVPEVKKEALVFTATIDNESARTSLNENSVFWEQDDTILINGVVYEAKDANGTSKNATFTPKYEKVAEPAADGNYYATYACEYDTKTKTGVLPSVQVYDAGASNAPMFAISNSTALKFKNICSLLKITLKGSETISRINVSSKGAGLSGKFTISDDGQAAVMDANERGGATIDCGSGVSISDGGKTFYVAVPKGTYTNGLNFMATTTNNGKIWMQSTKANTPITIDVNKIYSMNFTPEFEEAYVDLGLGVMWSKFNIGATSVDDTGDYFAWGETSPKNIANAFTVGNYKFYVNGKYTKYTHNGEGNAVEPRDEKSTLDPEDDAARVLWGGKWRMPTKAEVAALCSSSNCTKNIVKNPSNMTIGFKVKPNGASEPELYFANTGLYRDGGDNVQVQCVRFWATTRYEYATTTVYSSYISEYNFQCSNVQRTYGCCIRPVYDPSM